MANSFVLSQMHSVQDATHGRTRTGGIDDEDVQGDADCGLGSPDELGLNEACLNTQGVDTGLELTQHEEYDGPDGHVNEFD
jgi:hypothetical protein